MPLALHAPLPLPCWPQGARLGPLPFPLLLPLSWQLLAQLQPDTVLGPVPLIAGWLLICFSTGPRSPGNGMLHGSPAPEPRSIVGTTMLRLELEKSAPAGLLPCCLAAQCWGRDAPYTSLPEWVRTSSCLTLPSLPCCVLGAGDPPCSPAGALPMTTHQAPLQLLRWFPAPVAFWRCLSFMPPTLVASPGAGITPSCGLAACADGQPSQAVAPARLGHSFLPKSSLPLPSWGHQCLPPNHTLRSGCPDVATVLLVPLINTSLQVPPVSGPWFCRVRCGWLGRSCSALIPLPLGPDSAPSSFPGKLFASHFSSSARAAQA